MLVFAKNWKESGGRGFDHHCAFTSFFCSFRSFFFGLCGSAWRAHTSAAPRSPSPRHGETPRRRRIVAAPIHACGSMSLSELCVQRVRVLLDVQLARVGRRLGRHHELAVQPLAPLLAHTREPPPAPGAAGASVVASLSASASPYTTAASVARSVETISQCGRWFRSTGGGSCAFQCAPQHLNIPFHQ